LTTVFGNSGGQASAKDRAEKLRTRAPPQPGSGGKQSVFSLHQRAWGTPPLTLSTALYTRREI